MERINVSLSDLPALIRNVYDLSIPVGMGFLHYQEGPIPEGTLTALLNEATLRIRRCKEMEAKHPDYFKTYGSAVVGMDYLHGRCCKFDVFYGKDGQLYINNQWYDHADWQFDELLTRCQIKREAV